MNSEKPENQKVKKSEEARDEKAGRKIRFPYGESIPAELRRVALDKHPQCNPDLMFEKFRSWALANGKTFIAWDQAWRNWVINAPKFGDNVVRGNTIEAQNLKIQASKQILNASLADALGSRIDERDEIGAQVAGESQDALDGAFTRISEESNQEGGGLFSWGENEPF